MSDPADQPEPATTATAPPGAETGDSSGPAFERIDWLAFGITSLVALTAYLCTLAPEVTLEFSGTLATSANYAGVANPPGYPIWTVYSWLFATLLPLSNVAWRVATGSAVVAALACGLVALMVSRTGAMDLETTGAFARHTPADQRAVRVICGFVAGMALGLSQTVWRIAVVVETWAFGLLLFTVMLSLLQCWVGGPDRRRFLYGAFFVFGLLLTGNQELVLVTPALLLLVLLVDRPLGRDLGFPVAVLALADFAASQFGLFAWYGSYYLHGNPALMAAFLFVGVVAVIAIVRTRRFGTERYSAELCIVAGLLGLGCYLYLPLTSMTTPPVNWAYPRTVEGVFHLITRGQYERPNPTNELGRFLGQLRMVTKETWKGFGWPYFVFATLPFFLLCRAMQRARNWLLGLAAMFVSVCPLMVALLNPTADLGSVQLLAPWFGAMQVVLAVWVGLGLMVLAGLITKPRREPASEP